MYTYTMYAVCMFRLKLLETQELMNTANDQCTSVGPFVQM